MVNQLIDWLDSTETMMVSTLYSLALWQMSFWTPFESSDQFNLSPHPGALIMCFISVHLVHSTEKQQVVAIDGKTVVHCASTGNWATTAQTLSTFSRSQKVHAVCPVTKSKAVTAGDGHKLHSICALLTPFRGRQRNIQQQQQLWAVVANGRRSCFNYCSSSVDTNGQPLSQCRCNCSAS